MAKDNFDDKRGSLFNSIVEADDYGIINNIFEFVLEKCKHESVDTKSSSIRDKLIHIKDKIELNFKENEERSEVKRYFTQLFSKITFVEKAFQTLNSEEQNDVHFYILGVYNDLKRPENNHSTIKVLKELTNAFIPKNQSQNPTYRSIAQAIVLFFFDDCTIFEKTNNEPENPTLFDEL